MDKEEQKSQLGKLFETFRRPILLVLALIIFVIGYVLVLDKPIKKFQQNFSLYTDLNSDILAAQGDLKTSNDYSAKMYQPTELEKKILVMALPEKPDDSSIVVHVTSMARRAGLMISNIDISDISAAPNDKVKTRSVGKISVRLKLKGAGYDELKKFLSLTESSVMMMDVYSINFTSKAPIYDINLVVYYFNTSNSN